MEYKISKLAHQDLEEIWLYTFENWSIEQADRYFNLIMDEIEYITNNPESGKNYNEIRNGYLQARINSHFIFYKINKKKNVIEIIRILHQKMNIENRMEE
jgi:toxin ParE1/3/4